MIDLCVAAESSVIPRDRSKRLTNSPHVYVMYTHEVRCCKEKWKKDRANAWASMNFTSTTPTLALFQKESEKLSYSLYYIVDQLWRIRRTSKVLFRL